MDIETASSTTKKRNQSRPLRKLMRGGACQRRRLALGCLKRGGRDGGIRNTAEVFGIVENPVHGGAASGGLHGPGNRGRPARSRTAVGEKRAGQNRTRGGPGGPARHPSD